MAHKPKKINKTANLSTLEMIRAVHLSEQCRRWIEEYRPFQLREGWSQIQAVDCYPISDRWVCEKIIVYPDGERISVVCERDKGLLQPWRLVFPSAHPVPSHSTTGKGQ